MLELNLLACGLARFRLLLSLRTKRSIMNRFKICKDSRKHLVTEQQTQQTISTFYIFAFYLKMLFQLTSDMLDKIKTFMPKMISFSPRLLKKNRRICYIPRRIIIFTMEIKINGFLLFLDDFVVCLLNGHLSAEKPHIQIGISMQTHNHHPK